MDLGDILRYPWPTVCFGPNERVTYICEKTHSGHVEPEGIGRIVVGDMSAASFAWKTFAVATILALVIIFVRGDLYTDVRGEQPNGLGPSADAGPDQNVTGPTLVQLDGTASVPDAIITEFEWEFQYDGGTVTLNGSRPVFFFEHHGVYPVTLTVTDPERFQDSDVVNITVVTTPGEIINITVIGRNDWVEIGWGKPVHDGGSQVVGSIVYRGTTPDTLEPYYSDWWIRYWSWDSLAVNGQTYYYAVAALNDVGMGPLSHTVNATPMAVPDAPQNFTLEVVERAVHLTWDPPLWSDGRVNVTGYQVHRGIDPDWLYDTFDVGMNTSFVDEDVEEGVTYFYAIGADSSFGGSSITEVANVTIGDVGADEEMSEWWMVAGGFGLLAGLIVIFIFVIRMESRIGKKDVD